MISHTASEAGQILSLYAGKKGLAFRYLLPSSKEYRKAFEEMADDVLTYVPISIGSERTKSETTQVDGVNVITIHRGKP